MASPSGARDSSAAFYDRTALWWGGARITLRDRERARMVHGSSGAASLRVLELGAGFGGTAAALADLGHAVVAVERSPRRAAIARRHAACPRSGELIILEADFLELDLDSCFDAVCYWSGFGAGEDSDHRRLLVRVGGWLARDGRVLMDVFDPRWWRSHSGMLREERGLCQQLDFLEQERRLVDRWWRIGRPERSVAETIRCYDLDELGVLARGSGLLITRVLRPTDASGAAGSSYLVEMRSAPQ